MTYEEAFVQFDEEYINWLYDNYRIGNSKMLVDLLEDADIFDRWMADYHPEVEFS